MQRVKVSVSITLMQKGKIDGKGADTLIEKMFTVGAHYGYSKTRRHPSVSPYIYATKNKGDIINLEKTAEMLEKATEFIKSLGAKGKIVLFVGTKPEAKVQVQKAAETLAMPYAVERWIGGTISNFSEIKRRITELETYRKEQAEGGLEKYTKKERVVMAKQMEKLAKYYGGLVGLKKTPDALYIVDARSEHIALTEAVKGGVPVVTLVNSDSNLKGIDYPILGNDASVPSVSLFTNFIVNAYQEGLSVQAGQNSVSAKKE